MLGCRLRSGPRWRAIPRATVVATLAPSAFGACAPARGVGPLRHPAVPAGTRASPLLPLVVGRDAFSLRSNSARVPVASRGVGGFAPRDAYAGLGRLRSVSFVFQNRWRDFETLSHRRCRRRGSPQRPPPSLYGRGIGGRGWRPRFAAPRSNCTSRSRSMRFVAAPLSSPTSDARTQ